MRRPVLALPLLLIGLPAAAPAQTPETRAAKPESATRADSVRTGEVTRRTYVGVHTTALPAALQAQLADAVPNGGLLVTHVLPDSPAAKAGLRDHDVLVSGNGRPLKTVREFESLIAAAEAGTKLDLGLVRRAKPATASVEVGLRPVADQTTAEALRLSNVEQVVKTYAAARRASGRERPRNVPYADGPIRNRELLVTTRDGGEFRARAVEVVDGERQPAEFAVRSDAIGKLPPDVPDVVRADLERLVAGAESLKQRGAVFRFRVQPRSDGRRRSVAILLGQPGEDGEYRTCEIERALGEGDALPVDELAENETLAGELERVGPAVREKIESALRRYRVPPVKIEFREPQ